MRLAVALLCALAAVPAIAEEPTGAPVPQAAPAPGLPTGTVIPLVLAQELSSRTNAKGDLFEMHVAEDVRLDGAVVVPAGTRAVGEITRCDPKGAFGRAGKIEARALYIVLAGRNIRTTGMLSARGRSGAAETVLTTVAVGTISFVVTGRSAIIPAGSAVQATLDRDMRF